MIFINYTFFITQLSKYKILYKNSPLIIREIESNQHITTKYVNLNMYIFDRYDVDAKFVKALLKCQIFIINSFRIKMLINMNVLAVEDIDLIIIMRKRHIDNCYIIFEFTITSSSRSFIKQNVMLEKSISISTRFHITMPIEHVKLFFKNYIFESINECPIVLFAAMINFSFYAILIRNDFEQAIQLFRKLQIKSIMNLNIDDCYHINDFEKT